MCLVHYYLLNFIALFLKGAERGFSNFSYDTVVGFILSPFYLMVLTWFSIIPSILFMLLLVSYRVKMIVSFWMSIVCYWIILYFVLKDLMEITCITSTVISGVVVTAIFWKACKRLEIESRDKEALEPDNNIKKNGSNKEPL
jgi:hypothetical protein